MTTSTVLFGIAVFFSSILAGGVVTVSLVMIPALRACAPDEAARHEEFRIHKIFNPIPDYYMPQCLFVSAFAAIAILSIDRGLTESARTLAWVAIALSLPVIMVSLALNRRINLMIRGWTSEELPPGYAQLRVVWDTAHIIRTILCVIIAVCYIVGAVATR